MKTGLALAFAAIVSLCGCSLGASDNYTFKSKEFEHLNPSITFVVHKNLKELRAAAPIATLKSMNDSDQDLMAWSVLRGSDHNICEVHIVDPAVQYKPEFIGHEVTHCIYGRWHD